jgi:hypothetical protein
MRCCKRSKVCCCRKAGKNAHQGGPGWTATSTCSGGCGQLPAVPGTASASLAAARIEVSPVLPVSPVRSGAVSPRASAENAFALLQRPPPTA